MVDNASENKTGNLFSFVCQINYCETLENRIYSSILRNLLELAFPKGWFLLEISVQI